MSIPFGNVLTRPAQYNHRASGMGPPGAAVGQFADNALPFPGQSLTGMGGSMGGGYVHNKTDFFDGQTNGTANYHTAQLLTDYRPGDTGPEQITLAMSPAPSQSLETEKRLHAQPMFGVSMFNYMMQHDPSWRRKFGGMRSSRDVMKHFNYCGVQRTTQELIANAGSARPYSDENVFAIYGRTRVHNIWHAEMKNKGHVGEGMLLHLLLRRHRYVADNASRASAWTSRKTTVVTRPDPFKPKAAYADDDEMKYPPSPTHGAASSSVSGDTEFAILPSFDADTQEFKLAADFGDRTTAVDECMDFGDDGMAKDEPGQSYYWSWDPYVSDVCSLPGPELYMTRHGHGCFLQIGLVSHSMTGSANFSPDSCQLAREALYPTERSQDYALSLYKLPTIEVHLRVGLRF